MQTPSHFGALCKDGTRYCDNVNAHFREAGDAHKIISLRHTGWYVNQFCDETTRGIVLQIPARHGVAQYVAAYTDPWNDNAASVDLTETHATPEQAARAANSLASRYSELCRDDDAKQQAEQDIESAKESIAVARAEHSELCAEMRRAQRVQFDLLTPGDLPPARLTERAPSAICKALRKQLEQLRNEVVREIKTIRERRDNPWTAVSN
jgi:hypothetical protein